METKTREDIEELKRSWTRDPCWDIEDTGGFEEYKDELKDFRLQKESEWKAERQRKYRELASKICPIRNDNCLVEKCAWWNKTEDCCCIRALNLRGQYGE